VKKAILIAALVSAAGSTASAQQMWSLGPNYWPTSISDTGVVVGNDDNIAQYFMWSSGGGLSNIGGITGNDGYGGQATISNDGSRVGGTNINSNTLLGEAAIYDVGSSTWSNLGGIGGSVDASTSSGWGLSGDGQALVGLGWTNGFEGHAIHWSSGGGMVDMGSTSPGQASRANAANIDGTVVGGWQDNDNGRQGAVWVNGLQELIFDGDGFGVSEVLSVSNDGQWVTGVAYTEQTYRYNTITDTFQYIDPVSPGGFFFATSLGMAISDDGSTIVGATRDFGPPIFGTGWIWKEGVGTIPLPQYFDSIGVAYEPGFLFSAATAMSGDGQTIAGIGLSPSEGFVGWVVQIPTPGSATVLGLGCLVGLRRRRR
jgi:hypothetical protein